MCILIFTSLSCSSPFNFGRVLNTYNQSRKILVYILYIHLISIIMSPSLILRFVKNNIIHYTYVRYSKVNTINIVVPHEKSYFGSIFQLILVAKMTECGWFPPQQNAYTLQQRRSIHHSTAMNSKPTRVMRYQ